LEEIQVSIVTQCHLFQQKLFFLQPADLAVERWSKLMIIIITMINDGKILSSSVMIPKNQRTPTKFLNIWLEKITCDIMCHVTGTTYKIWLIPIQKLLMKI